MSDSGMREEPLIQPRLIRMLKDRPRLIDFGLREEVLAELDNQICERRNPQTVAERISDRVSSEVSNTTRPVVRRRVQERMERMNRERLQNL